MKRRPKTTEESILREKFEQVHLECSNNQAYRQQRREIKQEMKKLDKKLKRIEELKIKRQFLLDQQIDE